MINLHDKNEEITEEKRIRDRKRHHSKMLKSLQVHFKEKVIVLKDEEDDGGPDFKKSIRQMTRQFSLSNLDSLLNENEEFKLEHQNSGIEKDFTNRPLQQ